MYGEPPVPAPTSTRSKIELATAIIALVTAVVAGIFGITSVQGKHEAQATASDAQAQAGVLASENADLTRRLNAAQSEVARLKGAGTPTAAGSVPPAPTPTGPVPGVRRHGQLVLVPEQYADLDAPLSDPQWGALTSLPAGASHDLDWAGGGLGTALGSSQVTRVSSPGGYQACRTAQGYNTGGFEASTITPGMTFCVYTSEQRFALVKVLTITTSGEPITLDVTTYAKDGD